jgi:hypothetical protein
MKISKQNHIRHKPKLLLDHFKETLKPAIVKPSLIQIELEDLPLGKDCLVSDAGWIRREEYNILKATLSEMNLTKVNSIDIEYKNNVGGTYTVTYTFK